MLPFLLFTAGISGAWIANLTALEPYRFYFAGVAIGCSRLGFTASIAGRQLNAPTHSYCARPASHRIAKFGLWSAAAIVAVALASPSLIARWL